MKIMDYIAYFCFGFVVSALFILLVVKVVVPKEVHRQDVSCQIMQKNGYEVECGNGQY